MDLLNVLLDKGNHDPITLMDEKGREITFEQVAIVPHINGDKKALHVVLKPIDKIEGVGDDEAMVFWVDQDEDGNAFLRVEENRRIAMEVFKQYYDMLLDAIQEKYRNKRKKNRGRKED